MKVLFLAARFPFPPLKGDQVRAAAQLRLLGRRHEITLLAFEDDVMPEARRQVEMWCEVVTVPLRRAQMAGALLRGAASGLPLQTSMHRVASMEAALREQLKRKPFDVLHAQLVRTASYLEGVENATGQPIARVVDLIDALSLNMERRAQQERGFKRRMARLEAARLLRYERQLCRSFDAAMVVSSLDREHIGDFANLHVNPNGVDLDDFAPQQQDFEAAQTRQPTAGTLIFSGNMSYFPNVNAIVWFVREVLPLIKAQMPGVRLKIVGADPGREVRALANGDEAVTVTGFVPDMRLYLAGATVAVVPMRAGSGLQNKVIEAMACGTPVVVTPFALGGLNAVAGEHLLVAADAPAFAQNVLRLLHDPALRRRLSSAARRLVEEHYSWPVSTSQLEAIWQQAAPG